MALEALVAASVLPLEVPPMVAPSHTPVVGVLLYIGPDVFLPITSALAAVVGVALVFWQRLTALVGRVFRLIARRR